MDIFAWTLGQILSYGLMLVLLARALAHGFAARAEARRLRPVIRDLQDVEGALREGLPSRQALARARAAVAGGPLRDLFRVSARLALSDGIRDQIDEVVTACLGRLNEAVMITELAGPRFGLALTAAGIVIHAAPQAGGSGPAGPELSTVGIAVVTTGLGMVVAIVASWTLNRTIIPLASDLRQVATSILVHVTWPEDPRCVLLEAGHDAA